MLGPANRRAEAIKHVMRGGSPETFDVLLRRWVVGSDGDIYHYNYFDPRLRRFTGLWIYEFNVDMTRLTRRTFAQNGPPFVKDATWQAEGGWTREFGERRRVASGRDVRAGRSRRSSRRRCSRPNHLSRTS